MKKLFQTACAFAIGAVLGMSFDLEQVQASPLSIGMLYQQQSTQVQPYYKKASLVSTLKTPIFYGGLSQSFNVAIPADAEIMLVGLARSFTNSVFEAAGLMQFNGVQMNNVAQVREAEMAWIHVVGGFNGTLSWGTTGTTPMVASCAFIWFFKNVSKLQPVIGCKPAFADTNVYNGFSGQQASATNHISYRRFYCPITPEPIICGMATSYNLSTTEGTWVSRPAEFTVLDKTFEASKINTRWAMQTNLSNSGGTFFGPINYGFTYSGYATHNFSMVEVCGDQHGYAEMFQSGFITDKLAGGVTRTYTGVNIGPEPATGRRLVVITGQSGRNASQVMSMTVNGISMDLRKISSTSGDWSVQGCWNAWVEVPTGTTATIQVTHNVACNEVFLQIYSLYGLRSMVEQFGEAKKTNSSTTINMTAQSNVPWGFMFASSSALLLNGFMLSVNGNRSGNSFYHQQTGSGSVGESKAAGVIGTNFNRGTFQWNLIQNAGDLKSMIYSLFM